MACDDAHPLFQGLFAHHGKCQRTAVVVVKQLVAGLVASGRVKLLKTLLAQNGDGGVHRFALGFGHVQKPVSYTHLR